MRSYRLALIVVAFVAAVPLARAAEPTPFMSFSDTCVGGGQRNYSSPPVDASHHGYLSRLTTTAGPGEWDPGGSGSFYRWPNGEAILWDISFETVVPGEQLNGTVWCHGATSDVPFTIDYFDWPAPPVSFTVNTADTTGLGFLTPGTAQYVADLTRLSTGGAAKFGNTVVASSRELPLGTLESGTSVLYVSPVEGPTSKWTVTIRALPVIVSDTGFSSGYVRPGTNVDFLYRTSGDTRVTATVHDALGRAVATLASNFDVGPGAHSLTWDATDDGGVALPSGNYRLRLQNTDPSGATGSRDVAIVVDGERPTAARLSPFRLSRRDALVVSVEDRLSPLRAATLLIDGRRVALLTPGTGRVTGRPAGGWEPGRMYRWAVEATDAAGNAADAAGTVRVRGKPITTIGCADARTWTESIRRTRPRRCMLFRRNEPIHAGQVDLHKLRWRGWGGRQARARATAVYRGMGGVFRMPVRVVASGRRHARCGNWAYGRVRVTFMRGLARGRHVTLHPPRCRADLTY